MTIGSSTDTVHDTDRPSAAIGRFALFVVNDTGSRIVRLPASGALVVGRGEAADVKVVDPRVSRQHLRIHAGTPLRVEDLDSANGTVIAGRRLSPGERCTVAPGSAILMGGTTLVIRDQRAGAPVTGAPVTGSRTEPHGETTGERMTRVLALADRAAASMISVLLLGETGVGKDVIAERIHLASPRASGPFLRLNCAAFSSELLASELFGHEKGAFTGATSAQLGLLQSACGGTVLLDEVGDLPLDLQAKLLLVLERREVMPVGGVRPRATDVRFLAATNCDLPKEVAAGTFRSDLYFRLNGITIEVPPLRDRVSEIESLAHLFATKAARAIGRATPELTDRALAALRAYAWPGNIRELRTVIDRAVLLGSEGVIDVPDIVLVGPDLPGEAVVAGAGDGRGGERQRIVDALASCGGNQSRAAKLLGVSRNTLIARIGKYRLARPLTPRGVP